MARSQTLENETRSDEKFVEEIFRKPIGETKPSKFYVIEELIGFKLAITIVQLQQGKLNIIRIHGDDISESRLDWNISRIMNLNDNTFLVQEKGKSAINRLTFKYEGTTPYQTKLILQEFSSKI